MALSIDRLTNIITVPKADLTLIVGTLYEHDTDAFWEELKAIEAAEEGIVFPDTQDHNLEYSVVGVTYAQKVEIINGYKVEYENGSYSVRLVGSNNNLFDVEGGILIQNTVQVIAGNSAGLIKVAIPGQPTEAHISVTYDNTTIEMGVWLNRLDDTILNPISAKVDWYNPDGSLLFTITDNSPDSRGHFNISKVQALVNDEAYYANVTVEDASGIIVTRRGISTVATA